MTAHRSAWLAALLLAVQVAPAAQAAALPERLSAAIRFYAGLEGFSCAFSQALLFHDGQAQHYEGDLAVLPPKRFRWRYRQPYVQEFIGDGTRLWHYEPDLMQVRVLYDLDMVDPVVMRLLAGRVQLDEIRLVEAEEAERRYHILINEGTGVWLGLGESDDKLAYIETVDILGNRNRMSFSAWKFGAPPADTFVFEVPDGVDVVEER